jgi:4-amino-4-deoxy-L-arabinose transferase-like glycosyltransferase
MMNFRFSHKFSGWKWWLLICSANAYLYMILNVFWGYGDEGLVLYGAQLVLEGVLPYRGFFEVFGPGSFYWTGFFFKLFGIHINTARTLLLFTGVTLVILPMWMTRRIHRGPFELLPAIFLLLISIPIWPACSHHWDSNLFLFISLAMFLLWQDTENSFYLSMTGIFSGLTYFFLQQKGILLFLSYIVSMLTINHFKEKKTKVLFNFTLIIGSFSAVIITVLTFFYVNDGLSDMVYATIVWPLNFYKQVNVVPYGFGLREFLWQYFENSLSPLPSGLAISLSSIIIFPYILIFQ